MEDCLDLSHEVVAPRFDLDADMRRRGWVAEELSGQPWVIAIDPTARDDIRELIAAMRAKPLPLLLRSPESFSMPALRRAAARAKAVLDQEIGFVVFDHLPIDDYENDDILACYWVLGQLLGPTVAQKWDGTMIYDVTDTKRAYSYGVRGSATNVELVFHTDNAFGRRVPDYVGLLCKYPAASGGLSRFCSLYSVHDRLANEYPAALRRLYQTMYFDRQAEHENGAPKTSFAPFFSWRNDRLRCRANSSLVRKGYDVAGKVMDDELEAALRAVDEVTSADDLWIEAPLERGQVQYLNNHELGHYRSEFVDGDDPDAKRHLYRLWNRSEGDRTYDG